MRKCKVSGFRNQVKFKNRKLTELIYGLTLEPQIAQKDETAFYFWVFLNEARTADNQVLRCQMIVISHTQINPVKVLLSDSTRLLYVRTADFVRNF
uniref:AlNc14C73G4984 protein n=1 Tax=Albugo laibachii Nc14 TaxID=890382 RepID=F0WEC8_9STRA|nr:AlNc14C73G4984 [Albugo laibachii Nc14]|eukprot:CCA19559.1 AlNc14C73G4984 [Albugo laibachii Nc14]